MRIVTLVGNRPQFVKAAAVSRRLRERHDELLVHSGQHYDDELSAVFFRELSLPAPTAGWGSARGPTRAGRARSCMRSSRCWRPRRPDLVLVYGDTNTTLAGALSCARLGIPLAHVEAGMRSFDWSMPEERNRVLTDHVSELCLCSTRLPSRNLEREGIERGRRLVGDVMADVSLAMAPVAARESDALGAARAGAELVCWSSRCTGPATSTTRLRWRSWWSCCAGCRLPAVFPVHPRTTRGARAPRRARRAGSARAPAARAAARLSRLPRAPAGRVGRADGLRRGAEGGLPGPRALPDAARDRRSGPRPWSTAGTGSWASTRDGCWRRSKALRGRPRHPELYGGGRAGEAIVTALEEAWRQTEPPGFLHCLSRGVVWKP